MDSSGNIIEVDERPGMDLRQYAAIKLCVPDSGVDWLDDMIRTSLRDRFAGQAMVALDLINCPAFDGVDHDHGALLHYTTQAYTIADAMLAAGGK